MKQKILLTIAFVLFANALFAQDSVTTAKDEVFPVSEEMQNSRFTTFTFDSPAVRYQVDPLGRYLGIEYVVKKQGVTRQINRFVLYRIADMQKLWESKVRVGTDMMKLTEYGVLSISVDRTVMYKYLDGSVLYRLNNFTYAGTMGDRLLGRSGNSLVGYSLESGLWAWKTKVGLNSGLNDYEMTGQNSCTLITSDIINLNLYNGTVKKIGTKASISDTGAVLGQIAAGLLGAASGILTGMYYVPVTRASHVATEGLSAELYVPASETTITGLTSCVFRDNGLNYSADRENIFCFDDDMNMKWNVQLPHKTASRSELVKVDGKIYMVNLGFGFKAGSQKLTGRPFVAAFDAENGDSIFFNELSSSKRAMKGVNISEKYIDMLFDDAVASLAYEDDALVYTECDIAQYGAFHSMLTGREFYIMSNAVLFNVNGLVDYIPVCTVKGNIVDVNLDNAQQTYIANMSQLYYSVGKWKGQTLLCGGQDDSDLILLTSDGAQRICSDAKGIIIRGDLLAILTTDGRVRVY